MNISSLNVIDSLIVKVDGILFTRSSSLTVRNVNAVVDNCTFSDSIGNRALLIENGGRIAVKNSVFTGNLVRGGAEVQGVVFSSAHQ